MLTADRLTNATINRHGRIRHLRKDEGREPKPPPSFSFFFLRYSYFVKALLTRSRRVAGHALRQRERDVLARVIATAHRDHDVLTAVVQVGHRAAADRRRHRDLATLRAV